MNDNTTLMRQWIDQLNKASEAYYNGQGELMTDYEWDALFDKLKEMERQTGITLEGSPTEKVSEDNITGQKEEHEFAALSLAKTKSTAELAKWAEGRPVWLSWKLDGLTLVVTYDNGRLTKVVTRGNGHTGTNITHLAPAIAGILPEIADKGHVVVRGEAVISYQDFEIFNMENDEAYANPRNLASGSLTLKDINEVRRRHIQWIAFTLVHADEAPQSWGARMDLLAAWGFTTVERQLVEQPTEEAINDMVDHFSRRVTERENPYPVDGLVVTYDDTAYAATGSVTGHHATRAGLAFKWQDESAATQLDHIEWSCAASTISPVAVFSPVSLEGTTVKRASLCNISECERLGIGGRGTMLSVIKANKIIPKVVDVSHREGVLDIPASCPVCGAPTTVQTSMSGTKTLHCTNAKCPAKQLRKFARFVSKAGANIDGISEQTIAKFINLGWVSDYADLYHLHDHALELSMMEGFGRKSVSNMLRSLEKAHKVKARNLLYALSIPLCGTDVCKRLLAAYPLKELATLAATTDDTEFFAHIDGIGPEKSAAVVGWFHDAANNASAARLLDLLDVEEEKTEAAGKRCDKLTFVITGDVHHYKNRNKLKAYIESQGGKGDGERQQVDQLPDQQRHGFDVFKKQKGTRTEHPHHQRGGFHTTVCRIKHPTCYPNKNWWQVGLFVTVPILVSERRTRYERTWDETRSNAGRDAIERGRAFAKWHRERIGRQGEEGRQKATDGNPPKDATVAVITCVLQL